MATRTSLPILHNLTFRFNASFQFRYRVLEPDGVTAVDNTGWQIDLDIRRSVNQDVISRLSTATGEITLGGATGWVTVALEPDDIILHTPTPNAYVYDIRETYTDGSISYRFKGPLTAVLMVTRDA